jgi:hypothetical protein
MQALHFSKRSDIYISEHGYKKPTRSLHMVKALGLGLWFGALPTT